MAGGMNSSDQEGINDINITPFVDVVLVLLVIFIVTAPMMMKDLIEIKLPKTTTADSQKLSTLSIAITEDGRFILNGELSDLESIRTKAQSLKQEDAEAQVIIAADIETKHMYFVKLIDTIKAVGIENFAIQVEKEEQ